MLLKIEAIESPLFDAFFVTSLLVSVSQSGGEKDTNFKFRVTKIESLTKSEVTLIGTSSVRDKEIYIEAFLSTTVSLFHCKVI